jgi:hypothetical protein
VYREHWRRSESLEQHRLAKRILAEIRSLLEEGRLLLKTGTIVDATILAAPPSTKNERGKRELFGDRSYRIQSLRRTGWR